MNASRVPTINLARRPFRNNTIHYAVFATCFVLLAAASAYNVYDYVSTGAKLTSLGQELGERTDRYRGLADDVERMKAEVSRLDLTTLNTKSNFANGLILSRLFSWSALFDRIEDLIPSDVKIRSIRPAISPKGIEIQIDGMARTPQALYEFETALDGSNYFTGVYPLSESTRESKTELNFDLMMNYIPAGRAPKPPATPAAATAAATGQQPADGTQAAGAQPAGAGEQASGGVQSPAAQASPPAAVTPGTAPVRAGEAPAPQPTPAGDASGSESGEPAQVAPPPSGKSAPAMTNKEFLDAFGKARFLRARGKFGVRAPIEHPELNNEEFIQKYGMDVFLQSRGHLDRAGQVVPGQPADPNRRAP